MVDIVRGVAIFDTAFPDAFAINRTPTLVAGGFGALGLPIDSRLGVFVAGNLVAVAGKGDTFLFGGAQRLKILLLVDGESRL